MYTIYSSSLIQFDKTYSISTRKRDMVGTRFWGSTKTMITDGRKFAAEDNERYWGLRIDELCMAVQHFGMHDKRKFCKRLTEKIMVFPHISGWTRQPLIFCICSRSSDCSIVHEVAVVFGLLSAPPPLVAFPSHVNDKTDYANHNNNFASCSEAAGRLRLSPNS